MSKKTIIALLIVSVLFSSSIVLTIVVARQHSSIQTYDNWTRTQNVINIAFLSMKKANQTINFARNHHFNQSVLNGGITQYNEGATKLILANATLYNTSLPAEIMENYSQAQKLAIEAMQNFRVTILIIATHWDETNLAANWRALSDSTQRWQKYVENVYRLISQAKKSYPNYNFTIINNNINEAKRGLKWARANMTILKVKVVVNELNNVNQSLTQIASELKKIGESVEVKGQRMTQFINYSLKELDQKVLTIATTMGKNITLQRLAITSKINDAKTLANSNDLEGAISAIKESYRMLLNLAEEITR